MNREFSDGFMQDIAELLELCANNETDGVELTFNIKGKALTLDLTFTVNEDGAEDEILGGSK